MIVVLNVLLSFLQGTRWPELQDAPGIMGKWCGTVDCLHSQRHLNPEVPLIIQDSLIQLLRTA